MRSVGFRVKRPNNAPLCTAGVHARQKIDRPMSILCRYHLRSDTPIATVWISDGAAVVRHPAPWATKEMVTMSTNSMSVAQIVAAVDHEEAIEAPVRDGSDLVYGPMRTIVARSLVSYLEREGHEASWAPDNDDRSQAWVYVAAEVAS